MRVRAGVVIQDGYRILLMHRRRPDRGEYYLVPGGGVESGEAVREAALREIKEETNLAVTLGRELFVLETEVQREHYFEALIYAGSVELGEEEQEKMSEDNFYALEWISRERLEEINLQPSGICDYLLQSF